MAEAAYFLIAFGSIVAIGFAVVMNIKYRQIRRARFWLEASGKVLISRVESCKKIPGDPGYDLHDTEITNQPFVEYEYTVDGKKHRNRRIDFGDRTSEYELESILDRYPVGEHVTVYYDPANPQSAVLEREFPPFVWGVGIGCIVVSIGMPLFAIWAYLHGEAWFKAHLVNPGNAPFVTALTGFGILTLLFGLAFMAAVIQAARWPVTRGVVVSSGIETFRNWQTDDGSRSYRTHHKSSVVYEYEVNGRKFRGDRITMGVVMSATFTGFAKRTSRRYPVGMEVDVHYNPRKPSESVLKPFSLAHLMIFGVAAIVLWFAWSVATGRM